MNYKYNDNEKNVYRASLVNIAGSDVLEHVCMSQTV